MDADATMIDFLSGAITFGFVVTGIFFLRFWKKTRDTLFLAFALAFWLMGCAQALLALGGMQVEERSWVYLIRLVAFGVILGAIAGKNRRLL